MATLLLLSAPISLVSPLIIRQVVDDAVEHSSRDDVFFWGAMLVGLTAVSVVFGLGIGYSTTLFHQKVIRDVRMRLYRRMQQLSWRYHTNQETGWLMSRQVDDVSNLNGVMADAFARAGIALVRGIGYLVMLFYIEWRMATGGLALAMLIFGFEYAISGRLRERTKLARERWTDVSSALHQGISGHGLVRATASERGEAKRFAGVLHASVRAEVRKSMFALWTNHVFSLIGGVAPAFIVLAGVWLIVTSDFTVGGLFAFFMYLVGMFGAVSSVAGLNPMMQSSVASLERIFEVLDTDVEVKSPPNAQRPSSVRGEVVLEHVDFAYDADHSILHDVELRIAPREMVALVGPSGAGKTTLAHLLPRFFDPTSGRVLLDGVDLRDLDLDWYRTRVGLVPQEIFLFDRSVSENIAYGSHTDDLEAIREAARAANALEFVEALPEGFDTIIGERGVRLSGGQRQRLAIAREILRAPDLLILDEATSSLDSETEALIQTAMERLFEGRTSLVIAHRLSTIMRADLIVVVDGGRIVERGPHSELLARNGLYARLYRSQFRNESRPTEDSVS
ncbi:MAG: ABC transporter ATP-binding protein [Planctomycetes bacterium]|nr:ABC transporter ATP-binding protein [Planctomycetota bacterium]